MPQQPPTTTLTRSTSSDPDGTALRRETTKTWGVLKLRTDHDFEHADWWVASIAIPLLAATLAPLANVLSISALVSYWRTDLRGPNGTTLPPLEGHDIPDPHWVYGLNLASLITGYVGNIFLLMNFTNRIRYIIALPVTIILWYVSTATLIAIQVSMNTYEPPQPPYQVYSQAFWYGVIAAVLYMTCSMMLMVNMVGYFLGHYPQQFNLTNSQRTLILQTFLFFIWLAGGAAVYSKLETDDHVTGWNFSDALYFCDVTILTIGFGDLVPTDNVGRGLVIPYSIGGIIMLGLMVSSITSFAKEIGQDNIVKKRVNRQRMHTLEKSRSASLWRKMSTVPGADQLRRSLTRNQRASTETGDDTAERPSPQEERKATHPVIKSIKRTGTMALNAVQGKSSEKPKKSRRASAIYLREEKDRFDAMRKIQNKMAKFKKWTALGLSTSVLLVLWFVGAVVFWQIEGHIQQMGYFESLYFCFTALTTIGYGSYAPLTNAGRPFFVVWSLLAVPSITILISNMADTVVASFVQGTERLASFTLLPEHGIWRNLLEQHPWLLWKIQQHEEHKAEEKRIAAGFETGPDPSNNHGSERDASDMYQAKTIDELVQEHHKPLDEHELAHRLSLAIRKTAEDFRKDPNKRYVYEEWAEFTSLIRFTRPPNEVDEEDSEDDGLIEWDWIGEDSPMMTDKTEPEWLLDRLCESMGRYVKQQKRRKRQKHDEHDEHEEPKTETIFADPDWKGHDDDDSDKITKIGELQRNGTDSSSPASSSQSKTTDN